jgi:hypothetical protein
MGGRRERCISHRKTGVERVSALRLRIAVAPSNAGWTTRGFGHKYIWWRRGLRGRAVIRLVGLFGFNVGHIGHRKPGY